MNGCRIGKIKLKAGGAEVRILERPLQHAPDSCAGTMLRHARALAEEDEGGEMVAMMVVAIWRHGGHSFGYRYDEDCPVSRKLLPSYVAEMVRADLVTDAIAVNVFNRED